MQYKKMGRTGLKVSTLGIGTLLFGADVNETDSIKIMDMAFEKGINLFDTANGYADGRSEEIVGKALKNKRHAVVLSTKVADKQAQGPNDLGLSRKHILQAVEDSLRRLDTDYIDVYYAHFPDNSTPIEETLRTFDNLVQQGKVRYIACSNFLAWQLIKAMWMSDKCNLARFDCIQSPYNLLTREIETELLPFCASEGVGVIVYNSLAAELLADSITWENLRQLPRFNQNKDYYRRYWSPVNVHAVAHLKQIADAHGRSLSQFSLAWVLNNPVVTSIILSSFSTKQMEDNLGAIELKLTEDETKACDEVCHEVRPPRFFYGDVSDYLNIRYLTHKTQP